jgi:hypothetical protein
VESFRFLEPLQVVRHDSIIILQPAQASMIQLSNLSRGRNLCPIHRKFHRDEWALNSFCLLRRSFHDSSNTGS